MEYHQTAKKYFGYNDALTKKIQATETRGNQSPLNQQPVNNIIPHNQKKTTEEQKFSISGVNARTADSSLLLKAEHMLDAGADSETVRQETGWFQGYDGKMRFGLTSLRIWSIIKRK